MASWRRFHLDTGKFVNDTGDKFFAGMSSIGNRLSLVSSTFVKDIKARISLDIFVCYIWYKHKSKSFDRSEHRLNNGVRSPKFISAPVCSCTSTHCLWPCNPPPPFCIWAHIRGRYWSAEIDDISLQPPESEIFARSVPPLLYTLLHIFGIHVLGYHFTRYNVYHCLIYSYQYVYLSLSTCISCTCTVLRIPGMASAWSALITG